MRSRNARGPVTRPIETGGRMVPRVQAGTVRPPVANGLAVAVLALVGGMLYLLPLPGAAALIITGLGVPLGWLLWRRSELGLVALLFLVSSFIPRSAVSIELPVGGLDLPDLLLFAILGLLLLKQSLNGGITLPWWPVSGPLLLFLALALLSAYYALFYQGVSPNWALNELRPLVYLLSFFIVAWAVTSASRVKGLLVVLFLLADATALVLVIQQFFGLDNPLLASMAQGDGWLVWEAGEGARGFGAVRIIPPGHMLTYVVSVVAFALMIAPQPRPAVRLLLAFHFLFLNFALLFTYTRAQWIASILALGLLALFLPSEDKKRLVGYACIFTVLLALVMLPFRAEVSQELNDSRFLDLLRERFVSILRPEETLSTTSLQWRVYENAEAFRAIREHPLLGVGVGNRYREVPVTIEYMRDERFTRYIHNSYLYLAAKLGIPGLLAYLWFVAAFLFYGVRACLQHARSTAGRLILALVASFIGMLFWSFTQPHIFQSESTIIFGVMAGLIAVHARRLPQQSRLES